nr:hypothetical protein [uncultured Dongia sp.]
MLIQLHRTQPNRLRSQINLAAAAGAVWLGLAAGPTLAQEATPAGTPDTDWPCEQALRPEISLGAIWSGPDITSAEETWDDTPAVATLVAQIAPRRTPQEEAVATVHRFAAGYTSDRSAIMTQVFAGLFDTLNHERSDIIRGIRRFNERQDSLSKRIEEGWRTLDSLDQNSTDATIVERRFALQQTIDWDSRVFDDRQKLLSEVCRQPIVIEQRLFALSRAIQEDIAKGQ